MITETSLADLQRVLGKLMEVQEQLSSGKRINRPSDDPFSTHRAVSSRGALLVLEQFEKNINEIKGWVSTTDYALTHVTEALREVRTLAVQAANGYLEDTDRESIALRIDEYREMIFQLSQQQYSGRYIFSGTRTGEQPFTWTGSDVVYNGNDAHMKVNIGPGADLTFNLTGEEVFMNLGVEGTNLFKLLYDLAQAVRAGEHEEVGGSYLAAIDDAMDRVVEKLGVVGSSTNRLEKMEAVLSELIVRERSLLSEVEDVDLAEAVMNLNLRENAYQASLAACARVILPSILDYLG
jgi:flagellar hook-associated protein 3 FlgL